MLQSIIIITLYASVHFFPKQDPDSLQFFYFMVQYVNTIMLVTFLLSTIIVYLGKQIIGSCIKCAWNSHSPRYIYNATCYYFLHSVNGTSLHCGVDSNLCLRQNVVLYCNTTTGFLEWYSPNYKYQVLELDFSVLDYEGKNETSNGFTAILIGVVGKMIISSIEFTIQDLEYNNTRIICGDGYYYDNICTITLTGK